MVTNMDAQSLQGMRIILVDDESTVRNAAKKAAGSSIEVTTATFNEARPLFAKEWYDLAIVDAMSVSTLFLLETCVKRRIPVAVLGTHAANTQILRAALKLGAVSIVPTDAFHRLPEIVADIFENMERGDPRWTRLLDSVGPCFREEEAAE